VYLSCVFIYLNYSPCVFVMSIHLFKLLTTCICGFSFI